MVGIAGEVLVSGALAKWYETLDKPSFAVSVWLFSPVWFVLFLLTGIAASIIWHKGLHIGPVRTSLWLFLSTLVLNAGWFALFFVFHFILYGLIVIVALWVIALLTTIKFYRYSAGSGSLMIPYLLWIAYIAVLNVSLVVLNDIQLTQLFGSGLCPFPG